jgi:hypothetical protein
LFSSWGGAFSGQNPDTGLVLEPVFALYIWVMAGKYSSPVKMVSPNASLTCSHWLRTDFVLKATP